MANGRGSRPTRCRDCQKRATSTRVISFRGLCADCAIERQTKSAVQLVAGEGEYFDRWRARMRELMPSRADRF